MTKRNPAIGVKDDCRQIKVNWSKETISHNQNKVGIKRKQTIIQKYHKMAMKVSRLGELIVEAKTQQRWGNVRMDKHHLYCHL